MTKITNICQELQIANDLKKNRINGMKQSHQGNVSKLDRHVEQII